MHCKDTSSSWGHNQRALAKRTSNKYEQDVIIQNGQM